jgi:hypothetical protein
MLGLAASVQRLDATLPDEPPVLVMVVAAVGDQACRVIDGADQRCRARRGRRPRSGISWVPSLRLPPCPRRRVGSPARRRGGGWSRDGLGRPGSDPSRPPVGCRAAQVRRPAPSRSHKLVDRWVAIRLPGPPRVRRKVNPAPNPPLRPRTTSAGRPWHPGWQRKSAVARGFPLPLRSRRADSNRGPFHTSEVRSPATARRVRKLGRRRWICRQILNSWPLPGRRACAAFAADDVAQSERARLGVRGIPPGLSTCPTVGKRVPSVLAINALALEPSKPRVEGQAGSADLAVRVVVIA